MKQTNQSGQMLLMLILIMTVALAIGLSIVQKSLVDVSTSSKVEQSSRAFSAAEAGIEKALNSQGVVSQTFDNNSKFLPILDTRFPEVAPGKAQEPLEYPPLAKEDVAQVWLSDPDANLPDCKPPYACYTQPSLDVYWGNSATDKAALEITLIYNGTDPSDPIVSERSIKKYRSKKWYLDNKIAGRTNGFKPIDCRPAGSEYPVGKNSYQCKETLNFTPEQAAGLMLIRSRLLYNVSSQPFAVWAVGSCLSGCSIPTQARKILSTGISGETQRKINVFQFFKVVPPYFDYAIFSAGEITK